MANVYRDRDEAITKAMDDMHSRLRSGAGAHGVPRGTDASKPRLDYPPAPPLTIQPPHAAVQQLNLDGTRKRQRK